MSGKEGETNNADVFFDPIKYFQLHQKHGLCLKKREKEKDRIVMLFFTGFSGFLCSRVSSDVVEPSLVFFGISDVSGTQFSKWKRKPKCYDMCFLYAKLVQAVIHNP